MNNEQQQIIGEAYENYLKHFDDLTPMEKMSSGTIMIGSMKPFAPFTQEDFIDRIKKYDSFTKDWGLKIEERELSLEERIKLYIYQEMGGMGYPNGFIEEKLMVRNIPTKLITITYNNEVQNK